MGGIAGVAVLDAQALQRGTLFYSLFDEAPPITLTREGRALRKKAQDIPYEVLCASGQTPEALMDLRGKLTTVREDLVRNNLKE